MLPVDSIRYPSQILEAQKLLTNGSTILDVSQSLNLPKDVVNRIAEDALNQQLFAKVELSRWSPLFQLSHSYWIVIMQYFSSISTQFCRRLANVRNIKDFVIGLHHVVSLLGDSSCRFSQILPVPPFLCDLFALPHGEIHVK
jgi:hypothetical protein